MASPSGIGTVAGGNITQRRFLKQSAVGVVVMATAGTSSRGDPVYGISGEGTRNAPYSTLDDGFLAIAGENVKVRFPGEVCQLTAGGNVAVGNRLKSDSTGRGVAATANGDQYGAVALSAGAANESILVRVEIGTLTVPA
jgi:hypothetical protein